MKRDRNKLIQVPPLRIVTVKGSKGKCSRCNLKLEEGQKTIAHSTDGTVHVACLRVGQGKGKVAV